MRSFKYFFGKGKKVGLCVLKAFRSTKDYRFQSYELFLQTPEGVAKHIKELRMLRSAGYFSSGRDFGLLIQQANHERDLIQNAYENLINRTRIYFSLAAIIAVVVLGIISDNILRTRVQDHLESAFLDKLIVWVSLGILLYLIMMSIFTLSLGLRNYSSVWIKYTKVFYGGFKITRDLGISGQAAKNMELYTIAKVGEYNTKLAVMADIYWRTLLSDSIYRLVRTVTIAVFFSLYLIFNNPGCGVQIGHIVYGSLLFVFLLAILIKDRINVLHLIVALYSPVKEIEREI